MLTLWFKMGLVRNFSRILKNFARLQIVCDEMTFFGHVCFFRITLPSSY